MDGAPTPTTDLTGVTNDCERWSATLRRDPAADLAFVFAVRTTGVYCRPTCPARRPRRDNVTFYHTTSEAEEAGYRPCRRCRPDEIGRAGQHTALVTQVCRHIEAAEEPPPLRALAHEAGVSQSHLHRIFSDITGTTPKRYAAAVRAARVRAALVPTKSVTEALYEAGYNSASRFYDAAEDLLGMTPTAFRNRGAGTEIRFAVGECWLGSILVAATANGICTVSLGDDPQTLLEEFQARFAAANLIGADRSFEQLVAKVVAFVSEPGRGLELPLDIRGTTFQLEVWDALRRVPAGSTVDYSVLAATIGRPAAARAVAGACAANTIAVAIPCHRVVRADGSLSGYRWGVERKRKLLEREQR